MFRSKKNGENFIIFSNVEYELGFEEEKLSFSLILVKFMF